MTKYTVVKHMSEGVLGVLSEYYGRQLFTRVKLRKNTECAGCDAPLAKGSAAWSPITNGYNRMHRVCGACFSDRLENEMRSPHRIPAAWCQNASSPAARLSFWFVATVGGGWP